MQKQNLVACCGFSLERAMEDLPILQSNEGWDDLKINEFIFLMVMPILIGQGRALWIAWKSLRMLYTRMYIVLA